MGGRASVRLTKSEAPAEATVNPWRFRARGGRHELELFKKGQGWVVVGAIAGAAGPQAAALAGFMVGVLNERQQENRVLDEAVRAIKTAMQEGVNYATEMELDHAVRGLPDRTARLHDVLSLLELVAQQGVTEETQTMAERVFDELKGSSFSSGQFS